MKNPSPHRTSRLAGLLLSLLAGTSLAVAENTTPSAQQPNAVAAQKHPDTGMAPTRSLGETTPPSTEPRPNVLGTDTNSDPLNRTDRMDSPNAQNRNANMRSTSSTNAMGGGDITSANNNNLERGDQRFFVKATRLGQDEIALSRLAADRATNPQVRAFAAQMAREHAMASEELSMLAVRKAARLEVRDGVEIRETQKKWSEKKANDFDEAYLEAIIDAHQDTIDVLENGAESKDPEIAAYASKMLPTIKAHLAHAESLEDQVD